MFILIKNWLEGMIKVFLDNVYLNKELAGRYIMIKVLLDNVYLIKIMIMISKVWSAICLPSKYQRY